MEAEIHKELRRLGIEFDEEWHIGPYRADVYVPRLNLILEAHSLKYHGPERAAKDKVRLAFLDKAGYARLTLRRARDEPVQISNELGRGALVQITADDVAGQVGAAVTRRLDQRKRARDDYETRLRSLKDQIIAHPDVALPPPSKFRIRAEDMPAVRELQSNIRARAAAERKAAALCRQPQENAANAMQFEAFLARAKTDRTLAAPPPARFSAEQNEILRSARKTGFPSHADQW